jgi:hypothetical protein
MGTLENLSALAEELRAARERLEAVADRAGALQRRLRTDGPTIVSLDKLHNDLDVRRGPPTSSAQAAQPAERFEGEETALGADAWEISLINEEG